MRDAIARNKRDTIAKIVFLRRQNPDARARNLGFPDLLSERYSFPKINPEARTYFPSDGVLEERALSELGAFRRGRFGARRPRACGGCMARNPSLRSQVRMCSCER